MIDASGEAMKAGRIGKSLRALKACGPYLVMELLLPGGTLLAFLLWLSQRSGLVPFGDTHRCQRRDLQRPAASAQPHPPADADPPAALAVSAPQA